MNVSMHYSAKIKTLWFMWKTKINIYFFVAYKTDRILILGPVSCQIQVQPVSEQYSAKPL